MLVICFNMSIGERDLNSYDGSLSWFFADSLTQPLCGRRRMRKARNGIIDYRLSIVPLSPDRNFIYGLMTLLKRLHTGASIGVMVLALGALTLQADEAQAVGEGLKTFYSHWASH